MCGICGFNFEDDVLLKKMINTLKHRGPDGQGAHISKNMSLGHTRLAIIDLETGKQPIYNEDNSIVIIFNGEIFNYKELRAKLLSTHKFNTNSDTEVIIHAYEEYGLDFVNILEGQFAFALWDENKKRLLLARDNQGICPLYYYFDNTKFIFASEQKAILNIGDVQFNESNISDFLYRGFLNTNSTFFKNLYKLKPGELLIFKDGKISTTKNNYFTPCKKSNYKDLKNKIISEVNKSTISDVPIGLYLSGGLDSNIICSVLSKNGTENLNTFTIGFEDKTISETKYAQISSNYFNTTHFETSYTVEDVLSNFSKVTYALDQPIVDPAKFSYYFLSKEAAKQKVKVVLSGIGGDEIFCGYPQYRFMYYWKKCIRNNLLKQMAITAIKLKYSNNSKSANNFCNTLKYSKIDDSKLFDEITHRVFSQKDILELTKKEAHIMDLSDCYNTLDCMQIQDLETTVVNDYLVISDELSLVHGIEGRVPLLSKELINLGLSLNANERINLFSGKIALRNLFRRDLPKEIINKPKTGFTSPLKYWFENGLYDFAGDIFRNTDGDFMSKASVNEIYEQKDYNKIWYLLTFYDWYNEFVK